MEKLKHNDLANTNELITLILSHLLLRHEDKLFAVSLHVTR